ncbi:hypothetical protein QSG85_12585 [Acinetobacter baumannii]|uniref:hypothetical protein n=1 Tax=Acinetobacter baumannii TaxID=470 RepID=UPI002934A642|nr:hypothetical protein [Acinetobacter baumannii]WOE34157.1 hypothetical protein QSG85_12585 [Acinetobacter baumannii]
MKEFVFDLLILIKKLITLRNIVYCFTLYFFYILANIIFSPIGTSNTFSLGNLHINFESINLGELGSLLSGIFAPLAFLWLVLNMKQQDHNLKIAEEQLNILLKDKENRRKATRAFFSMNATEPEANLLANDYILFKLKITSDEPLKDCFTYGFEKNELFSLAHNIQEGEKYISRMKKNFRKDEVFYLYIIIDVENITKVNTTIHNSITFHYLDIDGYEQSQKININFYRFNKDEPIIDGTPSVLECGIIYPYPEINKE